MRCFRCSSFALFALLGVFFGSFIINQNDSFATSIDFTIDNTFSGSYYPLCNGNSSYSCSDYYYFSFVSQTGYTSSRSVQLVTNNFTLFNFIPYYTDSLYFTIPQVARSLPVFIYNADTSKSLTVRLSDTSPSSGITPSGSIELTENGTYDVSQYAEAVVNVPETDCPPSSGGDYHEDLVAINNSIMICAATCLVIYFFYCIYRMIIKNSGVK